MGDHAELIHAFYEAFAQRDHEAMAACYHSDVHFSDPVFQNLHGDEARAMWHMLCEQGNDLVVTSSDIKADGDTASAHWEASYTFRPTGRLVRNRVDAKFTFADGRIIRHVDTFDLWRWLRMAVGWSGVIIGWSSTAKEKVRLRGAEALDQFLDGHPEYTRHDATS
ncbi:MAG: nuclear transport factor 2 family protein [Actinomycetota bacterium]